MGGKVDKIRDELLGKEYETKKCGKCFIIDYQSYNNVAVAFYEPFCVVMCTLGALQKGHVSNPMFPTVLGKGYIGVGSYNSKNCGRAYKLWKGVLYRCIRSDQPAYTDVTICDEWLNFQNFAEWCFNQKFFNAKDDKGVSYQLDKDLLIRGNKIYSPDTCRFVPQVINALVITNSSRRGEHPIGTSYVKKVSKFACEHRYSEGSKFLGHFDTSEKAFEAYKKAKESYIKEVCYYWKDRVDSDIYESLMGWVVNMDD